jgi:hypothetical protein
MQYLILSLLFTSTPDYAAAARAACPHDGPHVDNTALAMLADVERDTGVADIKPGLLAAVWCVEAGLRHGRPIKGDGGRAIGPMQLWPTHRRVCGLSVADAHDLGKAARCWVRRIRDLLPKARKYCPHLDDYGLWRVAEAAVSNHHEYKWSCRRGSAHWRLAGRIYLTKP